METYLHRDFVVAVQTNRKKTGWIMHPVMRSQVIIVLKLFKRIQSHELNEFHLKLERHFIDVIKKKTENQFM